MMVSHPARLVHLPALARILWSFTRQTKGGVGAGTRRSDLITLAKVVVRGWTRLMCGLQGTRAFIIRDDPVIHALYVHRDSRDLGHVKALFPEEKIYEPTLELWIQQSNQSAIWFYQSQGFEKARRGDGTGNDEHVPDIRFVWNTGTDDNEVLR